MPSKLSRKKKSSKKKCKSGKILRKSYKTNEFVFVAKGKLQSDLYTEQGEFIETVIVDEGEGILLHNHAHHYKILEDSIILESKNGPFMGVEKDKTVIDVKKSKN